MSLLWSLTCLLMISGLTRAKFSSVYLSSFSNVVLNPAFCTLFEEYILPGDKSEKRLGYIGTAMAAFNPQSVKSRGEQRRRARYEAKQKAKTIQEGLALNGGDPILIELDNEEFIQHPTKLREALEACSVIYVDGGNTFYLQKAMRDANFWEIALPILTSGGEAGKCYMGCSAGGICAGESIKTALFKGWDDPLAGGAISEDYLWNEESYRGANLFGRYRYSVFPHYKEEEGHDDLIASKLSLLSAEEQVLAIGDYEAIVKREGEDTLLCFDSLSAGMVLPRVRSSSGVVY